LNGNVRIAIDSAELTADSGSATVEGDELTRFTLIGEPVRITHVIEARDTVVTGEARMISYDRDSDTFEMQGDVRFASGAGDNAITACSLTYRLKEMTFNMPPERGCDRAFSAERSRNAEETRGGPSADP
jgi:lipopolysaccharide transport protein LptA